MKQKVTRFRVGIATTPLWKIRAIAQMRRRQDLTQVKKESNVVRADSMESSESSTNYTPATSSSTSSTFLPPSSSSSSLAAIAPPNQGTTSQSTESSSERSTESSSKNVQSDVARSDVTNMVGIESSFPPVGASVSSDQIQIELDNLTRSSQAVKTEIGKSA